MKATYYWYAPLMKGWWQDLGRTWWDLASITVLHDFCIHCLLNLGPSFRAGFRLSRTRKT